MTNCNAIGFLSSINSSNPVVKIAGNFLEFNSIVDDQSFKTARSTLYKVWFPTLHCNKIYIKLCLNFFMSYIFFRIFFAFPTCRISRIISLFRLQETSSIKWLQCDVAVERNRNHVDGIRRFWGELSVLFIFDFIWYFFGFYFGLLPFTVFDFTVFTFKKTA